MPLSKEQMREYMRKRRLEKKNLDLGEKESVVETPLGGNDVVESGGEGASGSQPERPEIVTQDKSPPLLTATDRKFEDANPGYHIYGKDVKKRECSECGKSFTTRMELNRFCGPKCKREFLDKHFSTAGHAHE